MSDRDAFGRASDDDPLAEMGWTDAPTSATTTPTEIGDATERAGHAATDHAPPPPPRPQAEQLPGGGAWTPPAPSGHRPRPRRDGGAGRPIVAILIVLGVIGAVVVPPIIEAIDDVADELDDITITTPRVPAPDPADDEPPPVGLQQRSLVLRGNLAPALRRLRERAGGRIRTLRLAPDRIDVQVMTRTDRLRNVQATYTGEVQILSDTRAPGLQRGTIAWSQVDPSAPRRIVRAMVGGRSSRTFDYMVLIDAAGLRWSAFLTDNTAFTATPDGRVVTRLGG